MDKRKTILVCDDEEGIRESMKLILEKDYDIVFASSGDDAIAKIKSKGYSLVILDIKMPKRDGLETLKEIKSISAESKVIMATGYKSVDTAQEATRLGACDYIVKPFDRNKLLEVVKRHI